MTPTELEAIRKRANPYRIDGGSYVANPGLSPERDVRALLVYVDELRAVIAAAQKYTDNMGEHHYWRCCCSDSGPDCTCGGAELWAALAKLEEP